MVEDEEHIALGIKFNLERSSYLVELARDGQEGIERWKETEVDLIILDLMLPRVDGHDLLEIIRREDERVPILVLTAKDSIKDKTECFLAGADDYLSKPFSLEELMLRVERLLIRSNWSQSQALSDCFRFGGQNEINFQLAQARSHCGEFSLTQQELKVLKVFIENEGRPVSRQELLEKAWGYDEKTSTRTVDNFVVRFRKYFERDPKSPEHFKSVRSVGYLFVSN